MFLPLMVAVSALIAVASDLNQYGVADEREVRFRAPVLVGTTVLPAGEYKVIHTMQGSDHLMLFRSVKPKKARAPVLVPCALRPLDAPAPTTMVGVENEDGKRILTFLQFKGDTAIHVFSPPQ
jgi:hypothetical protein